MTGRPVDSSRHACAKCGEMVRAGDRFCPSCGSAILACERCAAPLGPLDRFCPRCGTSVGALPSTPIPTTPNPEPADENPWVQVVARLRAATAGEYEILRELGRGGMAAVYLAHEVALNRKVAIKVMSPALLAGEGMVRRFRQEAITVANMSHPNIITIYAVRQIDNLHFFAMKFVEGRSLEHIVRSAGPLPIPMVRGLLWMVGNALAYAHRRGVVHRDVKPANMLVDEDGNAVVTDFGIAKLVLGDGTPRTSGSHTQTGVIVGTPTYMSPEQCLARPVSAASDQYSLGLVAYELLTGRPPFTGSPFVVMHAHTEKPVPSIRDWRPDCDAALEDALMRMLAKDPAQRWPSVQHALAALGAAPLGELDPSRVELARLSTAAPFRRSDEVLHSVAPVAPVGPPAAAPQQPPPYVAAIEIFAPPQLVEVGDSFTLSGSPRSASGGTMPGVKVSWISSDENIAVVDESRGVVQAIAPGDVEITAIAEGVRNSVSVSIVPKRVATINISLPPGVVHAGDRVQLVASPEDKHHEAVSTAIHWVSADESVASVGDDGIVSAKSPGQVLVFAESQGVRGVARIDVMPAPVASVKLEDESLLVEAGESVVLHAVALDAGGAVLAGRSMRWRSTAPTVAEVLGDGTVQARDVGIARVTCSCEGHTATAVVTVLAPEIATVTITPPPPNVDLGLPLRLGAEVVTARGARIERGINWRSETPETATVSADGVVLPLAPGEATIVASIDGIETSVTFEVNPAPELIAPNATLSQTQSLEWDEVRRLLGQLGGDTKTADQIEVPAEEMREPDEVELPAPELAEPVDEESIVVSSLEAAESDETAADDIAPELTLNAAEDADDAATHAEETETSFEDFTDAETEVQPPLYEPAEAAEVSAFETEPLEPVSARGGTPLLTRRHAVLAGAAVAVALVAWLVWPTGNGQREVASASGALAVVDSAALDSTVAAAADSLGRAAADTAVPTSTAATPQGPEIVVAAVRPIRVGDSTTLRASIVGDTAGAPSRIRWSSSAPAIARVDERTGRVVGLKEGRAQIVARAGTATTTVPVRVLPAPQATLAGRGGPPVVADLIATEVKSALHVDDTVRLTAAALDSQGHSLLDRRASWRSERPEVASIDRWGLVTAHRVGKTDMVATLDEHEARVPINVIARPIGAAEVEAALRGRMDEFVAALSDRNVERLTTLYSVGSPQDQKNLEWLADKLRPEANLRLSRAQLRKAVVGDAEAVQELSIRLTWTMPNGRNRDTNATFRVRFTRDGEGWQPAGVRATRNFD